MKKEALRVSTTIPAAPTTVYLAWLSSEQHSAMTGGAAKIDPNVGGKFTTWNGYISGKIVALDLGRRIIWSWRTTDFPRDAHDSKVEIQFEALGGSTRITILHTEIPEGQGEQYRAGWNDKYFTPMRNYFSKYLPDPRKPPPPRRPPPPPEDDEEEEEETPKLKGKPGKVVKPPPPSKAPPSKAPPSKAPPSKAPASKAPAAKAPAAKAPPAKAPASKAPPSKAPAAKAPAKPAPKKPAAKPAPKKPAAKKPAAKPAPKKKKK
jgi:uncharacterized protein YndB with AHSA1/START domain